MRTHCDDTKWHAVSIDLWELAARLMHDTSVLIRHGIYRNKTIEKLDSG